MATCHVCSPEQELPDVEMFDHLRLMHPDVWGDGPERWPDGRIVVYDTTLTPGRLRGCGVELTRTRRELLAAVGRGRVALANGMITRRHGGGLNRRCDRMIREFLTAGLVELGPDNGTYQLTAAGQFVLGEGS